MATVVKEHFKEPLGTSAPREGTLADEISPSIIFVVTQSEVQSNGGVESITLVLAGLRRFRPIVITQLETAANRRWRNAGLRVLLWPMTARSPWSFLKANLRMFKLVRLSGCEIVHCNDIFALFYAAIGARLAGASVILNIRNMKSAEQRYGWRWQVARRLSTRQLVLSADMRSRLAVRLGLTQPSDPEQQRLEYIYSAVDLDRMSVVSAAERARLRDKFGIEPDCFAIGYVGAFQPRKGQSDFIRKAGRSLQRALPGARVYFVGDFNPEHNDYAKACLDAANESGLEKIFHFVGYSAEIADWYRALDLVIVASRNEGLARCMIESLACGTPVVSFDVCSAREILQGHDCGVVVSGGDYDAMVHEIVTLSERGEVRAELGYRAAEAAKKLFNQSEIISRYEQLYLSLTKS